jgi:hypothetical protein
MALAFLAIGARPTSDSATSRYRFEIGTVTLTDLSKLGQGETKSTADLEGILSVSIDEATAAVTVVLDTLDGSAEGQGQHITPALLTEAIGTSWTGVLDERGRLSEMETESSSLLVNQLGSNLLRGLFPYIKYGATVGDTWSDTLSFSDSTAQGTQETTTILNYTAKGDTTFNGMKALLIESEFSATAMIFQEAQGGVDIEGTSTGSGVHFVGTDGTYLGGTRTARSELEASGPALPGIIPLTMDTELEIELLP